MLEDDEDEDEMMDESTDGDGEEEEEGLDEDEEWHGIGDGAVSEEAETSDKRTPAPQAEGPAEVPQTSQPASLGSLPRSLMIFSY